MLGRKCGMGMVCAVFILALTTQGHTRAELNKEMIEDCILIKRDLKNSTNRIDRLKPKVDQLVNQVDEMARRLVEEKEAIDPDDDAAIAAYNKKVELYERKKAESELLVKDYNDEVKIFRTQRSAFDSDCKDKSYNKKEYDQVVKKLGFGM